MLCDLTPLSYVQAIYSDVDASSMHVRMADESYCVGGAQSRDSYLRMDKIIEIAKACGAQVIEREILFCSVVHEMLQYGN